MFCIKSKGGGRGGGGRGGGGGWRGAGGYGGGSYGGETRVSANCPSATKTDMLHQRLVQMKKNRVGSGAGPKKIRPIFRHSYWNSFSISYL